MERQESSHVGRIMARLVIVEAARAQQQIQVPRAQNGGLAAPSAQQLIDLDAAGLRCIFGWRGTDLVHAGRAGAGIGAGRLVAAVDLMGGPSRQDLFLTPVGHVLEGIRGDE